jgi:hypothetical protein
MIFLILAQHDLPKCSSSQHLEYLELLEAIDRVIGVLILEDEFGFGLGLVALLELREGYFERLGVEVEGVDGVLLLFVLLYVVDCSSIALERKIVVVVESHLFVLAFAV